MSKLSDVARMHGMTATPHVIPPADVPSTLAAPFADLGAAGFVDASDYGPNRDGGAKPKPTPQAKPKPKADDPLVRLTVEIPKRLHKSLRHFALDEDAPAYTVVQVLLELLESDNQTRQKVSDWLKGQP